MRVPVSVRMCTPVCTERQLIQNCMAGSMERLKSVLLLEPSNYAGVLTGTAVQGFTAPPESALSWCTMAVEDRGEEEAVFRLHAWNAPLTGVPHLWMALGLSNNEIRLCFDYLPRADADSAPSICKVSEHLQDVDIDLSEAEYNRLGQRWWLEAAERYYTLEAREFAEVVRELDGAHPAEQGQPVDRMRPGADFSGPLLVDVSFESSSANMRTASAVCTEAVRRWLGWKRAAMDRARRQGERDCSDTSGTVGWCSVAGARSQGATIAG